MGENPEQIKMLFKEENKIRFKSGNICYFSVQNRFFPRWISKDTNIKLNRTTILFAVFYGCETWSLILREECRLRLFQNRVLR